ncbi:hypothetical protein [Hugenholtzia roseola]|uniref:putative polyvalent protein kinase domain-containing protein n=1 Tax=Hugenholtzia roseola TaxID=1002 RepID=UPI000417E6DF|nr:hypothetical protein [Hugenholtzia roseola]
MDTKLLHYELQNILLGKSEVSYGKPIQAVANYLRTSTPTSSMAQRDEPNKAEETERLIEYINQNHLWNCNIDFDLFLSEGAEQKVFIQQSNKVLKLNDSIYYAYWLDYFYSLLLNNYFFPDTSYELLGFYKTPDNLLYAVVEQNYIVATTPTDLHQVKDFLLNNGFVNTRNCDYYHPYLGIILEDLHDENVLTANDMLYFIDTVFYVKSEIFWK